MGSIDQRMNYPLMEEMANEFTKAAGVLNSTQGTMKKLAKTLAEGALRGDAGDLFELVLVAKLVKKLNNLEEKMKEEASDIKGAVQKTRDGVATAKSRFA